MQMHKKLRINKASCHFLVTLLLFSMVFSILTGQVQGLSPKVITISQNGSLFTVDYDSYSNANCSAVFEHVNGLLNAGDWLRISAATYTANSSSLLLSNLENVTIVFESGAEATITDNARVAVLKLYKCVNCQVINATVDGNGYNQGDAPNWSSQGIEFAGCQNCTAINPNITNCATYGFINYAVDNIDFNCGIYGGEISLCQQNGVTLGSQPDNGTIGSFAKNLEITDSSDVGISAYGVGFNISGNYVHDLWMTNNTAARWGIASESGSYGSIVNNRIENCVSGIVVEQDPNTGRQYLGLLIENNNITNCGSYGISYNGQGYSVINNNTVTFVKMDYIGNNAYAGIMVGGSATTTNITNISVFNNTVLVTNTTQALLQSGIWVVSGNGEKTNCSIAYNNVTTPLSTLNLGIQIQTNVSNTKIENNYIKAYNSIHIEDSTCNNTRLYNNNISECNTTIVDNGLNTEEITDDTLQYFDVFSDDFSAGTLDEAWTRTSSWGDQYPLLTGGKIETYHFNDNIVWSNTSSWPVFNYNVTINVTALPASGVTDTMSIVDNVGNQEPVKIMLNNNTGTYRFGLQYFDGTQSLTLWDSTVTPTVDTDYNFTVLATKGSTVAFYIDDDLKGSASNLTGNSNFASLKLATLTSDSSDLATYFDNVQIWTSTGTAGNPASTSILTLNCPSYYGSISPINGTYIKGLIENQTFTLSPQSGATARLFVDGVEVSLTENAYTLNMSSSDHDVWALFDVPFVIYSFDEPDVYTLEISSVSPEESSTVTSSTLPFEFTTSGNDTISETQVALYYSNYTQVGINQTSLTGTFNDLVNGTYIIACSVEGVNGATDYLEVSFTVEVEQYNFTLTAVYISLQARDKDGLNLPRAVTFSGTLPNGTAYSVTSNSAGLYLLECTSGNLTVLVSWQNHLVKTSSTIAVTANASSNLNTNIARLNYTSSQYILVSVNGTSLNTPSYTVLGGWKIDNIAGSGQKPLVVDQANWVQTTNPLSIKVGGNSYGSTNWVFASSVLSSMIIDFNAYAEPTIEVIYATSSGNTSGSSGGDTIPFTPSPSSAPLGANDFQISNLELGTIQPNSTVTATLHLRYSGSSYTFKELYLSNPFYTWFIQDSVSLTTYVLTNPSESNADVTLTFQIPADVPIQNFEGEIRFTVLDAFGTSHTSSAVVSASVEGASEGFDFQVWFRANWWVAVFIVVAVFVVLGLVATKTRRH